MDDDNLPREDTKCLGDDETDFAPYKFTVMYHCKAHGMYPEGKPNAILVDGENKCCKFDLGNNYRDRYALEYPDHDGYTNFGK